MCVIHKRDKVSCVCFQRQREREIIECHRGPKLHASAKNPIIHRTRIPFTNSDKAKSPMRHFSIGLLSLSLSLFLVLLFSHSVVYTRGTCPDRQQWTFGPSLCVFTYYKDRKGIALFDL